MITLNMMVTPGRGFYSVDLPANSTVADLVNAENLQNRTIIVDGTEVKPNEFATTSLSGVTDVWATGGAKGA